jgi:hypothetical protein
VTAVPRAPVLLLHRFLGIGLAAIAAGAVVLRYFGFKSLPDDNAAQVVAYTLSGVAIVLAALAFLVFKPRVPDRAPGQSFDQYWATPEVAAKAMPVWFMLEGAGTLSAVGYLLTGEPVTAVTAGLANAAYWLSGPKPL